MVYVLISAIASALFASGYKTAAVFKARASVVNATMLLCGAALAALFSFREGGLHPDRLVAAWGGMAGVFIVLATTAFFRVMRHGRLAVQWTVLSMSVAVPTAASVISWGESPTRILLIGMGLTAIAVLLLGIDKGRNPHHDAGESASNPHYSGKARAAWAGCVAVAFLATGLVQVCNKAVVYYAGGERNWTYIFVAQGVAGMLAAVHLGVRREIPRRRDILLGCAMAFGGVAALFFLLKALAGWPGTVVFPLRTALVTLFSTTLSLVVWKERLKWPGILGIALAVAAVYCLGTS